MTRKNETIGATLILLSLLAQAVPAGAQTIRQIERLTITGNPVPVKTIEMEPRVIERQVVIPSGPTSVRTEIQQTSRTTNPVTVIEAELPRQSDFVTRLGHMLEQINMGFERGWLTADQKSELTKWNQDLLKETDIYRTSAGGRIPEADAHTLEKHLTGLQYTINQQIDAGSKHR